MPMVIDAHGLFRLLPFALFISYRNTLSRRWELSLLRGEYRHLLDEERLSHMAAWSSAGVTMAWVCLRDVNNV